MRDPRIQAQQQQRVQQQRVQQQRAPQQQAPQGPRFQHNLDGGYGAPQNGAPRQARQVPQQQRSAPDGRPPIGVPIGPQGQQASAAPRRTAPVPQQRAIPRGSVNDPVTHANGAQRVQAQLTYEQAQQSLFGNLNDDVQAPRALTSLPADPNAPIPTSQARPTQSVEQGSLGALAGGPRR